MDIQMEITWDNQPDGSLICSMGTYVALAYRVGSSDDPKHRMTLMHDGETLGSLTLPSERIACQIGEKALSLLAELDEKDAPTIDEMTDQVVESIESEADNGSSAESTELLGQGNPV